MSKILTLEEIGILAVKCEADSEKLFDAPNLTGQERFAEWKKVWDRLHNAIAQYNSSLGNKTANQKMADEFEK